jgi:hypothetical protein
MIVAIVSHLDPLPPPLPQSGRVALLHTGNCNRVNPAAGPIIPRAAGSAHPAALARAAGTGPALAPWAGNGPRVRCKGNGPRGPLTRPRLHGAAGTGPALAHLGRERAAGPMQGERAAGPLTRPRLHGPRERAGACSPGRLHRAQGNGQGSIPLARNHAADC